MVAATTTGTVSGAGTSAPGRSEARSRPHQARGAETSPAPFAEALEAGDQQDSQRPRPVRAPAVKRPAQVPDTETTQPNAVAAPQPADRREPARPGSEGDTTRTEASADEATQQVDGKTAQPADAGNGATVPAAKAADAPATPPAAPATAPTAPVAGTDGDAAAPAGGVSAIAGQPGAGAQAPGVPPAAHDAALAGPSAPAPVAPTDPVKAAASPPTAAPQLAEQAVPGQGKGTNTATLSSAAPAMAQPSEAAPKGDAKAEFRAELNAAQAAQAAPAASDAKPAPQVDVPPPPPQHAPAPAASGPLSLVGEVAQKVAAQTNAPGSVVPVHAVAVAIAARANAGSTRFDIRLDPAELGRIEVSLTLDREGRVKSKIVAEKPETLELLQRDQRNLERTLNQAGLSTSEGSVEFSLKDQGGQGMGRDQDNRDGARQWRAIVEEPATAAVPQMSAATYARLAAARGGVDIRI